MNDEKEVVEVGGEEKKVPFYKNRKFQFAAKCALAILTAGASAVIGYTIGYKKGSALTGTKVSVESLDSNIQ